MMQGRIFFLVLVSLVACATASPTVFLGGSFQSLAGTGAWGISGNNQLGAFSRSAGQWSTLPHNSYDGSAHINDIAPAGNGVFAVGDFATFGEHAVTSAGVAFWDGTKWCSIRQSVVGTGNSVLCDTATSCWVAGSFTGINNVPTGYAPTTNFVHYNFNSANNEWEYDVAISSWNFAPAAPLPADNAVSRLFQVGSIFYTSSSDLQTIYRGSSADAGWHIIATPASIDAAGATILDWTISGASLFAVTNAPTDNSAGKASAVLSGGLISSPCGACTPSTPTDWQILVANNNASIFQGYAKIAVTGTTHYLVTLHDFDGPGPDWTPKYRVVSHTGGSTLNFVGEPFQLDNTNPITQMWIDENSNVVVVGPQWGNLFYPPNTNDNLANSIVLIDRRPTDRFTQIAVFNGSRWLQAFGGGFEPRGNFDATNLQAAYNSGTGQWFFTGPFSATYDVHAESAAFFDDDSTLPTPFFPLFTRAITRRGEASWAQSSVYDMVCATSACTSVFIGGDFAFHGPDTFGAIAEVAADKSASPLVTPVGGGLWHIDFGSALTQEDLQTTAGSVFALARNGNFLYAGGDFARGSRPSNPDFVCLHNVARLDLSTENAAWEDLHAGCDLDVYDLIFWDGLLIAGGEFLQCGGGRVVNFVASYSYQDGDNAQWSSLQNGVDNTVFSLEVFQGRLIAGGAFTHAGGLPVTGVASWDGAKWRALVPACTDDCVSGSQFYYTSLQTPSSVFDLRTDLGGNALWARIITSPTAHEVLGKWEYTDGDLGQWTVAGDEVLLDAHSERRGHTIANFGQNDIVLAAAVSPASWHAVAGEVGLYHSGIDNWVADTRSVVGGDVFIIRGPEAASASALSSPLSVLLSLF